MRMMVWKTPTEMENVSFSFVSAYGVPCARSVAGDVVTLSGGAGGGARARSLACGTSLGYSDPVAILRLFLAGENFLLALSFSDSRATWALRLGLTCVGQGCRVGSRV